MKTKIVDILLVEDSPYDAELTMAALFAKNITNHIHHVEDGAEALDFIFCRGAYEGRDFQHRPRLILLDLKMPKVSGMEVLRELKSNPLTQKIPVVVLTSSKEEPDVENAYRLGVNSYIVKPVGFENFAAAVSEIGLYWALLNQPPN
ncbi:MAG: response regulator [Flavobacteriales bacterium]|nr:response regulator [Flavobacteriales bacterium]